MTGSRALAPEYMEMALALRVFRYSNKKRGLRRIAFLSAFLNADIVLQKRLGASVFGIRYSVFRVSVAALEEY